MNNNMLEQLEKMQQQLRDETDRGGAFLFLCHPDDFEAVRNSLVDTDRLAVPYHDPPQALWRIVDIRGGIFKQDEDWILITDTVTPGNVTIYKKPYISGLWLSRLSVEFNDSSLHWPLPQKPE